MKKVSINFKIFFIISIILVITCSFLKDKNIALVVANFCEVIYLLLNTRKNKHTFLFAIVCFLVNTVILLIKNMYGSALYNLLYIIPLLCYGYYSTVKEKEFSIKKLDNNVRIYLSGVGITLIVGIAIILHIFEVEFALLDTISLICGAISIFLISNRYIEQWVILILVNLSNAITWGILSFNNIVNLPNFLIYIMYIIISIYGLLYWRKNSQ